MALSTILSPLAPHNSRCGYCGPPGQRSETKSSWRQAECMPIRMTCEVYQKMIDRGWRRSGTYCYKPDLKRSCCPQYTIKLDAIRFKPSKSQRKLVNRWNRFVLSGDIKDGNEAPRDTSTDKGKPSSKAPSLSLVESLHSSEVEFCSDKPHKHKFEVSLEPASFSEEKFALYQSYQKEIHLEEKEAPSSFKSFLVDSPLHREPILYPTTPPAHLPREYGAYHQTYRLDGELIALGVIDILPKCVSSVYFMYEKKWEKFSWGKLSALREASLAKEMHEAGVEEMDSLYMGFYIHSCPKMRYKGDYSPSYLVDPEEYTWHPLEQCRPLLDKYRYVSFAHPEHNLEGSATGAEDTTSGTEVPLDILKRVMLLDEIRNGSPSIIPVTNSPEWQRPAAKRAVGALVNGLGQELVGEVVLYFAYEI